MRISLQIVDADRHVMEPVDLWREYLPANLQQFSPYLEPTPMEGSAEERLRLYGPKALFPLAPTLMFNGKPVWNQLSERSKVEMSWASFQRRHETAAVAQPQGHLDEMDRTGVSIACLYPTLSLYVLGIDGLPPGLGAAFARAYNDWLGVYCKQNSERLWGVGLISTHDPEQMAEEAERVAEMGFRAVVVLPNPNQGRLLSNPAYEAFWTACERLSMGISIHASTHGRLPTLTTDRFQSHFGLHAGVHPMEQMAAFLTLLEGGVFERHPSLRFAFLESGCGWIPYWLYRLDEIEFGHHGSEVAGAVRQKPSEYFKRQCFIAFEPDEPYLPALLPWLGADQLMFCTDFPHSDHGCDIVDKALALEAVLPAETLRKLLRDNAARFYGLDTPPA